MTNYLKKKRLKSLGGWINFKNNSEVTGYFKPKANGMKTIKKMVGIEIDWKKVDDNSNAESLTVELIYVDSSVRLLPDTYIEYSYIKIFNLKKYGLTKKEKYIEAAVDIEGKKLWKVRLSLNKFQENFKVYIQFHNADN